MEEMYVTNEEFRELSRWLSRRKFLWFHAFDECEPDIILPWFHATFNLSKVQSGQRTVGIQLSMQTDSPFGYGEEIEEHFSFTIDNMVNIIEDKNDEVGIIWPEMIVTCNSDGELRLSNELTGCLFRVKNCVADEVLTQYGDTKIIEARKRVRNLIQLPGSADYKSGASSTHGGLRYNVDESGIITIA